MRIYFWKPNKQYGYFIINDIRYNYIEQFFMHKKLKTFDSINHILER